MLTKLSFFNSAERMCIMMSKKGKYPVNLVQAILRDDEYKKYIQNPPKDIEETLDFLLGQILPRRRLFLEKHYKKGQTYVEIGKTEGISSSAVTMQCAYGIRSIRQNNGVEYILQGYEIFNKVLSDRMKEKNRISAEKSKKAYEELCEREKILLEDVPIDRVIKDSIIGIAIDDLNLSSRTYNALKRRDINTVAEIVDYEYHYHKTFSGINNFGIRCFNELKVVMDGFGIQITF